MGEFNQSNRDSVTIMVMIPLFIMARSKVAVLLSVDKARAMHSSSILKSDGLKNAHTTQFKLLQTFHFP